MNKIYDKLLLALAILALLGGVAFFVMQRGESLPNPGPVSFQADDNAYIPLERTIADGNEIVWPDAVEQAPTELFDVFTPPKIYINEAGQFVFEPPIKIGPVGPVKPPFGVYLASIEQELYRIQFEGYIEEDLQDASKSLLLMFDEERGESVRARIGQVKESSEFEVLDFTINRTRDANGLVQKTAKVTIKDLRLDETVELMHGETLYEDSITVVLRSEEDPSVEVVLNEAGTDFETPAGSYTLTEINLEESSVTVEKKATEDQEAEVKTLQVTENTPNQTTTVEPSSAESTSDADEAAPFDFNF